MSRLGVSATGSNLMNEQRSPVPPIRLSRLCWIGFTTFIIRSYEDIARYFFLTIAPSAVTTALYFVVFGMLIGQRVGSIGGIAYKEYIAPGLIVMPIIANSYSHASLSFCIAKIHKLLDEHLISPLPSWMIVVSYVAGGSIRGILVGVSVGVIVLLFAHTSVQHFLTMIGALLLTSLVSSLAGFINGVFAKTFDQANWIPSFVVTPLTYLGGVFYSVSLLPTWAQNLSRANPIFYMVNLVRYSMLGVSDVHVGLAVTIILLAAVAMFAVATTLMARGTGIRE
jgi:ABC-2 type transport system permease protein